MTSEFLRFPLPSGPSGNAAAIACGPVTIRLDTNTEIGNVADGRAGFSIEGLEALLEIAGRAVVVEDRRFDISTLGRPQEPGSGRAVRRTEYGCVSLYAGPSEQLFALV